MNEYFNANGNENIEMKKKHELMLHQEQINSSTHQIIAFTASSIQILCSSIIIINSH